MTVQTDLKVSVELEIKEVIPQQHSVQLTESNAANDWWPETKDWTTYKVVFTNGATKEFDSINQIQVY